MELKNYQQAAIRDLKHYLRLLRERWDIPGAFREYWREKGRADLGAYTNILPGVPSVCLKAPTGSGKTFLACNALRPIFDALPFDKLKVVVWLVPSDTILTQTVRSLKDARHPYRQKLDNAFQGRVEVYAKDELLQGQNFSPTSVCEQLSVMVLSYDSFRGRGKDILKAYQENSNLMAFAGALGRPKRPIADADETALFQVINQLEPVVIVDESHHAKTKLSLDMLRDFNPCFVLELTATPRKESNIITYVNAAQLKHENMVKLPVIVYNRASVGSVLLDAIKLRHNLERCARELEAQGGPYIRPIVLFQAQPQGAEKNVTFEKLKNKLRKLGIPEEEIAIRTADNKELDKHKNLLSPDCPIRYIITVNALKEGWDCPFAYILASTANRSSIIEVEQILGRILRLPYARKHGEDDDPLNTSYVITSSEHFNKALQSIIEGLNNAGFSGDEYRVAETEEADAAGAAAQMLPDFSPEGDDGNDFELEDDKALRAELERWMAGDSEPGREGAGSGAVGDMMRQARETARNFNEKVKKAIENQTIAGNPPGGADMPTFRIRTEFQEEAASLRLPQFCMKRADALLSGDFVVFKREALARDFRLQGCEYRINFTDSGNEVSKIDAQQDGNLALRPTDSAERRHYIERLQAFNPEAHLNVCKLEVFKLLDGDIDNLTSGDLKAYVENVVSVMDDDALDLLKSNPHECARQIQEKIQSLLVDHYQRAFFDLLDRNEISCRPTWSFPVTIRPSESTKHYGLSLYEGEGGMNELEAELVRGLLTLDNIRWWHRNLARTGFCINGFINHYPDFLVMTRRGTLLAVETKGEHLKGDDTEDKIRLGNAWRVATGNQYRYYLVFKDNVTPPDGGCNMAKFLEQARGL